MAGCWLVMTLAGCADPTPSDIQELTEAQVESVTAPGTLRVVRLPHAWNREGVSGQWRYHLQFDVPAGQLAGGWGLYLPRVGNRFHVVVNDQVVARFGELEDVNVDHAQQPHHVYIAPQALKPGRNALRLDVAGERARFAGVARVVAGPPEATRHAFAWRDTLQTKGSFAVIAASLLFLLAAIPLALRLQDRALVLFCLACGFCALRTSYAVVTQPPLPFAWWGLFTDAAYAAYLLCLAAFCMEATKLRSQPMRSLMWALAALSAVCIPVYAFARVVEARQYWLLGMVLFSVVLCGSVLHHGWMQRTRESVVLALAGAGAVAMAIYDHVLVFHTRDGFSSFAVSRYSLMLFLVAMGWLLLERRRREDADLAEQRLALQAELASHKQRLEQAFDEQQGLASRNAQQRERDRILGDLHDGMGLQLQALLAQVESGSLKRGALAREVRTAIEQMRMLVSNAEQFEGDALMLLGQVRHQIERRLRVCGITLNWHNAVLPGTLFFSGERGIALQRLLFELTTNVIRHSGASGMSVEIAADALRPGGVVITLSDDGCGFQVSQPHLGNGLRSMARRVADLQARGHYLDDLPRGTRYVLHLPPQGALLAAVESAQQA